MTAVKLGLKGYVQIYFISTLSALDDYFKFLLLRRTIPYDDRTDVAVIIYLRRVLGVRHLGVIQTSDLYGNYYVQGLTKASYQFAPNMNIQYVDIPMDVTAKGMIQAVDFLNQTEFRFFSVVTPSSNFDMIITIAYKGGITSDGIHNGINYDGVQETYLLHLIKRG